MDEAEIERHLAFSGLNASQAATKAGLFVEATGALLETGVSSDDLHHYFIPGRIEFLGKHTDYAGGRSLICALERGFCVTASPRDDSNVRITDARRQEHAEFGLMPDLVPRPGHWSNYPMTVASRLAQNFPVRRIPPAGDSSVASLRGADIAFVSDLPA